MTQRGGTRGGCTSVVVPIFFYIYDNIGEMVWKIRVMIFNRLQKKMSLFFPIDSGDDGGRKKRRNMAQSQGRHIIRNRGSMSFSITNGCSIDGEWEETNRWTFRVRRWINKDPVRRRKRAVR